MEMSFLPQKIRTIFIIALCWCFFSCQPDYEEWYTPAYLIVQFKEGMEHYSDNAWVWKPDWSKPYYGKDWLQPLYPLGNGYYISIYPDFYPDLAESDSTVFLSTTREEWNAGNKEISNSLMLNRLYDALYDNHIWISIEEREHLWSYLTIEKDTLNHRYIAWADTAWFRLNVLNMPIDQGHFVHF